MPLPCSLMEYRCAEVMHGVRMCQRVASHVSEEARIGGSLVSVGVETECKTFDIAARLLQALGVKEDFSSKIEGESAEYQRLSSLDSGTLLANLEWLSGSNISSTAIEVGSLSHDYIPSSHGCNKYVFAHNKVFKRNVMRTICFAVLLIGLLSVASWATIAQAISAAERVEKWLTLSLFGCIAITFTIIGSDRRRDLLRELFFFREEMFSSAGMGAQELSYLIIAISNNFEKRRDCVSKKEKCWMAWH